MKNLEELAIKHPSWTIWEKGHLAIPVKSSARKWLLKIGTVVRVQRAPIKKERRMKRTNGQELFVQIKMSSIKTKIFRYKKTCAHWKKLKHRHHRGGKRIGNCSSVLLQLRRL